MSENIWKLPLLTNRSYVETSPMAGKSWQPSPEPPCSCGVEQALLAVEIRLEKEEDYQKTKCTKHQHLKLTPCHLATPKVPFNIFYYNYTPLTRRLQVDVT